MRLIHILLRVTSWLLPAHSRDDWLLEWQGEFHYSWGSSKGQHRSLLAAVLRCGGAVTDAVRLRARRGPRERASFIETIWADIRFGLRTLRKRPLFTTVAVLTLGLGIGAATAMFSVVDGVLLRSVPFREPGQLFNVWQTA